MSTQQPTALVTGGAKRVGKAICEDLAAHGWNVVIHAHSSAEEAEALSDSLNAAGGRSAVVTSDLADVNAHGGLLDEAAAHFGPVNVLVNNASVFEDDEAAMPDFDNFDAHFALHVKTPLALSAAMRDRLGGASGLIVNMIDQRVWALTPRFFTYTLSKSTLWTATRTLAQAFAPDIRVNAIGPGPTLPNERQSDEDFKRQTDRLLLGKGPLLTEFGATIRYLWDAESVTGQMIALDGGQHLAWETPDVTGIRE